MTAQCVLKSIVILAILVVSIAPVRVQAAPVPNRWAVVVGIDDYPHPPLRHLNYTPHDTIRACAALTQAGQFPRGNVFPLTTPGWKRFENDHGPGSLPLSPEFFTWFRGQVRAPSKANIEARLRWLKDRIQPGAVVLFYFSGHGLADKKGESYIAPVDARGSTAEQLRRTCIASRYLTQALRGLGASAVVVMIDACRDSPSPAKGAVGTVPLSEALARGLKVVPVKHGDLEASATVFSCKVGQESYEWPKEKQGFFTFFLVRGLLGAAADSTGRVTLSSLQTYLAREVKSAVSNEIHLDQVPWVTDEGTDPGSLTLAWPFLHKTVCILPFANSLNRRDLSAVGVGLAETLSSRLSSTPGVRVVDRGALLRMLAAHPIQRAEPLDERAAAALGQLLEADYVVSGAFEPAPSEPDALTVQLRVIDVATSRVEGQASRTNRDRADIENFLTDVVAKALQVQPPPPVPQPPRVASVPTLLDEGTALFDAEKYAEAFHTVARASDADLDNVALHRWLEKCARRGEREDLFLERYSHLVKSLPNGMKGHTEAVIRNYLGNAYLMLDPADGPGEARAQYEQARSLDPSFAPPLNNLGIIAFAQGNPAEAEGLFRRFLEVSPEDAPAWVNLGLIHAAAVEDNPAAQNRADAAEEAFKEALRRDLTLASAYTGLGRVYAATGRKEKALAEFRSSLKLDRKQPEVSQQLEALLVALDRLPLHPGVAKPRLAADRARAFNTRAPTQPGTVEQLSAEASDALAQARKAAARGETNRARSQWDKAADLSEELRGLLPANPDAWRLLGQAYRGQGRTIEAEAAFAKADRISRR